MESIKIKEFGGLKEATIPINKINLFIGKQASGKSVVIKLMYFFKSFFRDFYEAAEEEKTEIELKEALCSKFKTYFPVDAWPDKDFEITFFYTKAEYASIRREGSTKIELAFSPLVDKQWNNARRLIKNDKAKFGVYDVRDFKAFDNYVSLLQKDFLPTCGFSQLFIPAGRSFFATLQRSIFSLLSSNNPIDPFLASFGSFYEKIKGIASTDSLGKTQNPSIVNRDKIIAELITEILGGTYHREKNKDYIVHEDHRKVNLAYASSGQQETLPIALILKGLIRGLTFLGNGLTLYIEEPEAHLFPTAQKKIVELIATVFNLSPRPIQIVLTTHSPYIISSFNNLLQAGLILNEDEKKKEKIDAVFSSLFRILPKTLHAFELKDRKCSSILDKEYQLIDSEYLDEVSDVISNDFDHLLNID